MPHLIRTGQTRCKAVSYLEILQTHVLGVPHFFGAMQTKIYTQMSGLLPCKHSKVQLSLLITGEKDVPQLVH